MKPFFFALFNIKWIKMARFIEHVIKIARDSGRINPTPTPNTNSISG
ncbi:hypothetical protein ES703_40217 [subsurface metagenome]